MATKDEQRLTPYSSKESIAIKKWLNLYEIVCEAFKLTSDKAKITRMMAYLKEDALEFYSDDIVPDRNTLTWDEVRQKFESRFGSGETEPVTTAIRRRLKREESVKQYYDSKLPLLRRTGMTINGMCAILTEGLPQSFRPHFYGRRFEDTLEWLRLASDIEADVNSNTFRPQHQTHSSPQCKYCRDLGLTEYHWHNECPNRRSRTTHNRSQEEQSSEEEEEPSLYANNTEVKHCGQCNAVILNHMKAELNPKLIEVVTSINDVHIPAIVDTGSTHSCISSQLAAELNLKPKPNSAITISQVNSSFQTQGCIKTQLTIANRTESVTLHIIPRFRYPLLIGLDIGTHFGLQIDLNRCTVSVSSNSKLGPPHTQHNTTHESAFGVVPIRPPPFIAPHLKSKPKSGQKQSQQQRQQIIRKQTAVCNHMHSRPLNKTKEKTISYRKPALDSCRVPLESKRNKLTSTPIHNNGRNKRNQKTNTSQTIKSITSHQTQRHKQDNTHVITQKYNQLDDAITRSDPEIKSLEISRSKHWSSHTHRTHRTRIWFNSCLFHGNKLNGSRRV